VVEKILWLRQQYHFGLQKIAMYLKRYHDLTISSSGVWRILHKVGLGRLPASQRYKRKDTKWKRYEKQRPGHALQVDVKFIEPLGQTGRKKRYYQYTAIDDCTRVLRAYPTHDQKTAIRFIDHVLSKLPFKVEKVQTDNGSEFGQSFHWHRLDKGIYTAAQWQGRKLPPDRLRRVPPAPRGLGHRRCQPLQRQAPRMGGLLQLRSTPRRPRRINSIRAAQTENTRPPVIGLRQLHTHPAREVPGSGKKVATIEQGRTDRGGVY
jgi:hypothetical protein